MHVVKNDVAWYWMYGKEEAREANELTKRTMGTIEEIKDMDAYQEIRETSAWSVRLKRY